MSAIRSQVFELQATDGHAYQLIARIPPGATRTLLWLPALGVAARHYLLFADALAAAGTAVFLHEWRGHGSSALRAGRHVDWGYRELLTLDLPTSEAALAGTLPGLPRVIGGHSLGGQLACLRLALAAPAADALWLVASGSPYWRAFPWPQRAWLPLAYRFLPWLAERNGALPGRRIRFGGNESRGLIADWARSARSGRYAARGVEVDLEQGLQAITAGLRTVTFADDWFAPESSLRFLLRKMPLATHEATVFDAAALGTPDDHFSWMRAPGPVAEWLSR